MDPNKENYFSKTYLEFVFECIDYIEKNIDRLSKFNVDEVPALSIISDKKDLFGLIAMYKKDKIDDGLGLQLIARATLIKTVIEDKKIKDINNRVFHFFEHAGKYYLKN